MTIIDTIKTVIEYAYYISGIGLLIGLLFAFKQLKLMREDYNTKNKRAAIEKSIEYLNHFATVLIPSIGEFSNKMDQQQAPRYKGPRAEDFRFNRDCNQSAEYIQKNIECSIHAGAGHIMNQLEYISAAFVSGLADEKLAFAPLAEHYCDTIEELYPTICYTRRKDGSNLYSNVIQLYNVWNARLEMTKLENDKSKIDDKMSKIKTLGIKSLWEAQ